MKKIYLMLLFLLLLVNSCQYYEKQLPSKEQLLQKELKAINWDEVDEFPSIAECEKIEDKNQRQQCFFDFLTFTIQQKLSVDSLAIFYPELDTIKVQVTVFPDASLQFESQITKDTVGYDVKIMNSLLRTKLIDFPKVNPAIKRGIPVKTQFVLPIILKEK